MTTMHMNDLDRRRAGSRKAYAERRGWKKTSRWFSVANIIRGKWPLRGYPGVDEELPEYLTQPSITLFDHVERWSDREGRPVAMTSQPYNWTAEIAADWELWGEIVGLRINVADFPSWHAPPATTLVEISRGGQSWAPLATQVVRGGIGRAVYYRRDSRRREFEIGSGLPIPYWL